MLAIDLAVMAGVIALGLGGMLGLRAIWRKAKPETQGRENARQEAAEWERRCHFCKKPTDQRSPSVARVARILAWVLRYPCLEHHEIGRFGCPWTLGDF